MTAHRDRLRLVSAAPAGQATARRCTAATVRAAQQGDVAAFERLVAEHQAAVFGFCVAYLGDDAAGEDAAQDALVKAFRRLDTYRHEAPFRTWLLQIARHTCQDRLRGRQRRGRALSRYELQPELPHQPPSPDRAAEADECRTRIHAALAEVPPAFREVLVLFELQGWSYPEIAAACEIPVGTVKSRLARGREALRQALFSAGAVAPRSSARASVHATARPARAAGKKE